MNRGGGLHPAGPDCWPPTKRPRATPGGLIAAVPPCLRTSPPLGGTLEVHRTSWRIPFPRHACMFLVRAFRGALVSHAPPRVQRAAQALGCSFTPGLRISFGRVSCMARAASVPGLWTLGFLLLCGLCVWVRIAVGCGFG